MGSCVSVHKSSQESAMKLGLSLEPKTDSLIIPPSPVKEKPAAANGDFALKSQSSSTFKDLDFTPSHSNTPVHQSFSVGTSQVNKVGDDGSPGSVSETSPSGKKKKLVELFQESIRDDHNTSESNTSSNQDTANEKIVKPTIQDILPPKSADGTPYVSGANSCCSSERTVNGDNPIFKEKPLRSVQCCLPSLVSCSSFSERKKKMSPAIAANNKP
ncbi:hypothetical protein ES319_D04G086800v1 [Gossypium barbadense]|uniref:Uncharacterized protein n=1 Tax=Gossypium barbadense TaxID=3634 RepID=A0A5J5RTA8_GOSBA|nr:hypothetical protein ES319_D04G086800v1 [Gossypium barbadense]